MVDQTNYGGKEVRSLQSFAEHRLQARTDVHFRDNDLFTVKVAS